MTCRLFGVKTLAEPQLTYLLTDTTPETTRTNFIDIWAKMQKYFIEQNEFESVSCTKLEPFVQVSMS